MNFNPQALQSQLSLFKKNLLAEQKKGNQVLFKQLIKSELTKILQNLPQGLDKNQLLILFQDIFGQKNFQNGKYKGGQEVIIETVQEFFGKENFKNGKFTGGWNEKQDTSNIHKVFGEKNFTNGEYTGGWNKQQDSQNLKQSLTNGEAKTLTSQIIEEKFGGGENFADGIYKSEEETIQIVKKGLENKGEILRTLQDIIGKDKFYSEEGGENIPPGREGKYKDDREIALLQAKYQAEIKATEDWLKFFKKHLIPSDKETLWRGSWIFIRA